MTNTWKFGDVLDITNEWRAKYGRNSGQRPMLFLCNGWSIRSTDEVYPRALWLLHPEGAGVDPIIPEAFERIDG
jgi:hypothetical protein